ncbi:type VI secretion system lipoprotein TssJ [Arhodomonas sp. SL1]|uniref:type VI secretion system lipoprotein TssJ n=1 Tax=Arhodomonas sp. SL1 TaxID=3425691 RepID=UPI003F883CB2
MSSHWVVRTVLALLTGAALIAGCASTPPSEEVTAVEGRILVGPNLNPNAEGRPSPVYLRVYQLTEAAAFSGATYGQLADRDTETLGASLITRDEFELCPREAPEKPRTAQADRPCQGAEREIELDLKGNARFLAVMGEFYDLHDPSGSWRDVAKIPESGMLDVFSSPSLVIEMQGATVDVRFE